MGGTYGTRVLYLLEGLAKPDIYDIGVQKIRERQSINQETKQCQPTIAVDCNNVINVIGRYKADPVAAVANFLDEWAQHGFHMIPIVDGSTPCAKIATIKHIATREKNRVTAVEQRLRLRIVNKKLVEDALTEAKRLELQSDCHSLGKSIKKAETQSLNVVPTNFAGLLAAALVQNSAHDVNTARGTVTKVRQAHFQADSLLNQLYVDGECEFIMSNDLDYPVQNGDGCMAIKVFTGGSATISSTSNATLKHANSCLEELRNHQYTVKQPPQPMFEGLIHRRLRVLLAVIVDSDALPGGVPGLGFAKVAKQFSTINVGVLDEQTLYDAMIAWAEDKSKCSFNKDILNTLVDGIVYEPTNEKLVVVVNPYANNSTRVKPNWRYVVGQQPMILNSYLREFASSTTTITNNDAVKVLRCNGPSSSHPGHNFFAAWGHSTCEACGVTICKLCTITVAVEVESNAGGDASKKSRKKTTKHCIPCSFVEILLPASQLDNVLTVKEMKQKLKNNYAFDGADKLTAGEVEEAWADHSLHRNFEDLAKKIEFPLLPASAILTGDCWEIISEVDFSLGGSFITEINDDDIPSVLELLAAFVYYESTQHKHTEWIKDGAIFNAVPKLFIDLASRSRSDSGYRLLRRMVRHAFDNRTESLDSKIATLIRYKGDVGILVPTPIPASMKKAVYEGETVITKDKLLACGCDCKSGGDKRNLTEKLTSACVHSFGRLFLLSILLAEDLAEHILLELSSKMTSSNIETDTWSPTQIQLMRTSILCLSKASGNVVFQSEIPSDTPIFQMLQCYRTGTQQAKEWNRPSGLPTADEVGPISTVLNFDSPEYTAKMKLGRAFKKQKVDRTEDIKEFKPNYIRVCLLLNALGFDYAASEYVGYRLLKHRREIAGTPDTPDLIVTSTDEVASLLKKADARSFRMHPNSMNNLIHGSVVMSEDLTKHWVRRSARTTTQQFTLPYTPPPKKRKQPPATKLQQLTDQNKMPVKKRSSGGLTCIKCYAQATKSKHLTFSRIPPMPPPKPESAPFDTLERHHAKVYLHYEMMRRIGKNGQTHRSCWRLCSNHPVETKRHTFSFKCRGKEYSSRYEFRIHTAAGPVSSLNPSETTKGTGIERFKQVLLNSITTKIDHSPQLSAEREIASLQLLTQQVVECHSTEESPTMCPSTIKAAMIVPHKEAVSRSPFGFTKVRRPNEEEKKPPARRSKGHPTVLPSISNGEVKRRTGFGSAVDMMAYTITICNGDLEKVCQRKTSMTWFEEWFMYFEWTYGQTCRRNIDMEFVWKDDISNINAVKDDKALLELAALRSWPRFASFEEDAALRKKGKWSRYDGHRPVMWDMTNVSAQRFSDPSLQRVTYSEYYAENCFKGGVFCQLCGWLGNDDLWGGGVSDTDYNNRAGYLQAQEAFQNADLVYFEGTKGGTVVPFLNVLDRGYRAKMAAWVNGKQLALQPPSSRSDQRFRGRQTVFAATVAHDRSGNERAVSVNKRSGIMQRGYQENMNPVRFNNTWRAGGFRANFMYKPVL